MRIITMESLIALFALAEDSEGSDDEYDEDEDSDEEVRQLQS